MGLPKEQAGEAEVEYGLPGAKSAITDDKGEEHSSEGFELSTESEHNFNDDPSVKEPYLVGPRRLPDPEIQEMTAALFQATGLHHEEMRKNLLTPRRSCIRDKELPEEPERYLNDDFNHSDANRMAQNAFLSPRADQSDSKTSVIQKMKMAFYHAMGLQHEEIRDDAYLRHA
ncbi:hypothetical protein Slin15195_G078000 [Septoria linicola]|uniref:Uncharacterized protein n=1 Tax=Septoria linicola TaxID=215465 RepID=A0A9Q9EK63_9PEZI|nr:hypothetical protein Slin14017_G039190 [Septoria linicola]USW54481.1 hypothetical protein Slin15195_G078000 [Septoria linicola]